MVMKPLGERENRSKSGNLLDKMEKPHEQWEKPLEKWGKHSESVKPPREVVKPLQKWENRSQIGKTAPKLVNVKKGTRFHDTIKMRPVPGTDVSSGEYLMTVPKRGAWIVA